MGNTLLAVLPDETRQRLLAALESAANRDIGDMIDGVTALHEIATGRRSQLSLHELLELIEARIKEARYHAASLACSVQATWRTSS